MPKIEESIEIEASKDQVWDIISNLENEPEYWYGTREVRTISRNGNEIEREITQMFRNIKTYQKAILRPKESIEIRSLRGLIKGVKFISIEAINENRQRLNVFWDIHYTGIYKLLTPLIKRHTRIGTIHALQRIKATAEAVTSAQSAEFLGSKP
jgi:ribosome-associated toxin RatA of RatAB toxin-antitoxin module